MADEERTQWLPPEAPGGQPPPRWQTMPDLAPTPAAPPAGQPPHAPPGYAPPGWQPPGAPGGGASGWASPTAAGATPPPAAPAPEWWHQGPTPAPAAAPGAWPGAAAAGRTDTNSMATASLVLGIAGLALLLVGVGWLFFLNLPASVMAWVFGTRAVRRVDRGETTAGRGTAQAGRWMGIVGVVLAFLAMAGWAIALALSEQLREDLFGG